jgi:hypothetical protein
LSSRKPAQSFDDGNFPDSELISAVDDFPEAVCGDTTLLQAIKVKPGAFQSRNHRLGVPQLHSGFLLINSIPQFGVSVFHF